MIKFINYDDFFDSVNGIIIDNMYDDYLKNQQLKVIANNKINYILSQDNDLSYLNHDVFKSVDFLTISKEAENIECIYNLSNLQGIKLYSSVLKKIEIEKLESLNMIYIIYDESFDLTKIPKNINKVGLRFYKGSTLNELVELKSLVSIRIDNSSSVVNLNGIQELKLLECLTLDYCKKLYDISALKNCNSLISIKISDCPRIEDVFGVLEKLDKVENLELTYSETANKKISSIVGLKNMIKLRSFTTNYQIIDGNLYPLIRLKSVNILKWYKNYNIKDRDLPHEYVLFKEDNKVFKRNLKDIESGRDNKNIIWMDEKY